MYDFSKIFKSECQPLCLPDCEVTKFEVEAFKDIDNIKVTGYSKGKQGLMILGRPFLKATRRGSNKKEFAEELESYCDTGNFDPNGEKLAVADKELFEEAMDEMMCPQYRRMNAIDDPAIRNLTYYGQNM